MGWTGRSIGVALLAAGCIEPTPGHGDSDGLDSGAGTSTSRPGGTGGSGGSDAGSGATGGSGSSEGGSATTEGSVGESATGTPSDPTTATGASTGGGSSTTGTNVTSGGATTTNGGASTSTGVATTTGGAVTTTPGSPCRPEYALVPGSPLAGGRATDFCLARFEMKAVRDADQMEVEGTGLGVAGAATHTPEPRRSSTPWGAVDLVTAIAECASLGPNVHLVTNAEWITVARNIESNTANWSGEAIGVGTINTGHSDGWAIAGQDFLAAGPDDSQPCFGTGNPNCADRGHADFRQKRTHLLSNGEVIWDFAGNVNSWVDINGAGASLTYSGSAGNIVQLNSAEALTAYPTMNLLDETGFFPEHLATYGGTDLDTLGLGILRKSTGDVVDRGLFRGGKFDEISSPLQRGGIFSAWVEYDVGRDWNNLGFRCVHEP